MDLASSAFFCENPVFMFVQVMVIPLDITTTQTNSDGHKDGIFMKKYGAVQVHFDEVVLLRVLVELLEKFCKILASSM